VNVRAAASADVAGITAIERSAAFAAHWSPEQYARIFTNDSHRFCLVIEDQSQLRGFLVARVLGNECELENVVVAPADQRRGFGSALLASLLKEAASRQAEAIFLEVRESNTPARRLYAKCGFVETARRKSYYSDPVEDAILYTLNLKPKASS
jgi:ribosomal-protein-alanine N-acetyltransferase